MKVTQLHTEAQFVCYADFPHEVYRDNPYWVPGDRKHLVQELAGNPAAGAAIEVQPFWVESDGRVLGTVTAAIDGKYNARWDERTGHLIYFEALPECHGAAQLLVSESCSWLRSKGCNRVRASMLLGWQLPWTIDAYAQVPSIFHTYNPPYYHGYLKSAGFFTEKGVVQYQVTFTREIAERYRAMVRTATAAGATLRSWDMCRVDEENLLFTRLWNETFEQHWGSSYLPPALMAGLTVELKDLLVPDFCVFAEIEGDTAGVVYSLPDLNQAFHALRGAPKESFDERFHEELVRIEHGVLLVIGVRQHYRGKGINLGMAAKSYLAMMERGYRTGSYTVVLDDNWPSRRTAEKLGCRVTRNFNVYAKTL